MAKNGLKQYFMASESNPFIFYIFTFYCLGFYELCAWTRPKSWVPHSKSYGTSVSLTEDVGGSAYQNLPPVLRSTHSRSMEEKENVTSTRSLRKGSFVHIPWGHRPGHSPSHREDPWHPICCLELPVPAFISRRNLQCRRSTRALALPKMSPECLVCGPWTWLALSAQKEMNALSSFRKSSKYLLAFFQI